MLDAVAKINTHRQTVKYYQRWVLLLVKILLFFEITTNTLSLILNHKLIYNIKRFSSIVVNSDHIWTVVVWDNYRV